MKLMCLNIWGGVAGHEPLIDFFNTHQDIDIFCLQEVWEGGRYLIGTPLQGGIRNGAAIGEETLFEGVTKISGALPNHTIHFSPYFRGHYGIVFFVKKPYAVLEEGNEYIYREEGYVNPDNISDHVRTLHYIRVQTDKGPRLVAQMHGLWNGQGKGDSADRLAQSDKAIAALKNFSDPTVLCGDFNLTPDTESLKKFEAVGFRNRITENGITSTRASVYTKPIKFADYAFTDDKIVVNEFKVLPDEVSDHLPLYLDFD